MTKNWLVSARESVGLSQAKLGKLIGVSQQQVLRWEKNPNCMRLETFRQICSALKLDPSEVLCKRTPSKLLSNDDLQSVRIAGWSLKQILEAQRYWQIHHSKAPET